MAQELIESVLHGLDNVVAYIDDIAILSDDWETHLATLNEVLSRLNAHGCAVNPEKCEWAVKETDFLGHDLTPNCWNMLPMPKHGWLACPPSLRITRISLRVIATSLFFNRRHCFPYSDLTIDPALKSPMSEICCR